MTTPSRETRIARLLPVGARRGRRSGERSWDARSAGLTAEQAAWLAAVPTALLTLLAILVLGPPLGRLAFPSPHLAYWPELARTRVHPEETEQARYLLALTAPFTLAVLTTLLVSRPPAWSTPRAGALVRIVHGLGVLTVLACFVAQWTYVFRRPGIPGIVIHYFSGRTLVAAAALAAATVVATRSSWLRATWSRWATDTALRRGLAATVAVAAIVLTVSPAIQTDGGIAAANQWTTYHLQFTFDETSAVVNGRSPLGDFATQYAALWPYALAAGMAIVGDSLASFTIQLALLSGLTMLALYSVLRRVTRSSLGALLLFLPVLAASAFFLEGSDTLDRYSLVTYFGTLPLRYAAPFGLLWLTARHLDGVAPKRTWPLFLVGGLAAVNNVDFGLPALCATLIALLVTRRRGAVRPFELGREAATGLAAALVPVVALLMLRTGAPPQLDLLLRYANVFLGGFSLIPIQPTVGVSTLIFLTYVASIGVAVVRTIDMAADRVLTGALLWCGIFGLGAGGYYAGHSIPEKLIHQFPIWALALALLAVASLRRLAARPSGRPALPELACLFGLGLLACSLAQTPQPWSQLDRIQRAGQAPLFSRPAGQAFVASQTRPGEAVIVFTTLGHRTAVAAGVRDVEPYTGSLSVQTEEQLADSVRALREAGGSKLFLLPEATLAGQQLALQERFGFVPSAEDPTTGVQMWTLR